MKVDSNARERFEDLGIDRKAATLLAKSLAQQIIDESDGSDHPLSGIVYDVWSLYNEGIPRCRFTVEDETDAIRFKGVFREDTNRDDCLVERTTTCADHEIQRILQQNGGGTLQPES